MKIQLIILLVFFFLLFTVVSLVFGYFTIKNIQDLVVEIFKEKPNTPFSLPFDENLFKQLKPIIDQKVK